ncbi:MAG: 4Fe-4S double cluster binding domain-containing protein [Promethearchaeota archaeon]
MNENRLIKRFHKSLEAKGYQGQIVHAEHIPDLRNDIRKHHEQNLIYPPLYNEYKAYFEFEAEVDFARINSLLIIAIPQPQTETIFYWNKKKISLIIPPTYLYGREIIDQMTKFLSEIFKPAGYNIAYAILPLKTLAVRSGLAEYGRNNITYLPEMGSFHRLTAFYSDFPIEDGNWQDLQMMDLCKECSACIRKCPTGAIPTDRFLLRVERCITYHNEQPEGVPFPDWLDPSWHNCLVGCLHCQKICPANKKVKNWIEPGPIFTEKETKLLLNGRTIDNLPSETKKKIEDCDFVNYLEVFPRNLSVFLKSD